MHRKLCDGNATISSGHDEKASTASERLHDALWHLGAAALQHLRDLGG